MLTKFNVTFLPDKKQDLNNLLLGINERFENSFSVNGNFISTKERLENLDDKNISELKNFSIEKKLHLFISWISDDISEAGMIFYNYERNDEHSLKSNLGATNTNVISFLIFCGMGEYLSEVLF